MLTTIGYMVHGNTIIIYQTSSKHYNNHSSYVGNYKATWMFLGLTLSLDIRHWPVGPLVNENIAVNWPHPRSIILLIRLTVHAQNTFKLDLWPQNYISKNRVGYRPETKRILIWSGLTSMHFQQYCTVKIRDTLLVKHGAVFICHVLQNTPWVFMGVCKRQCCQSTKL